MQLCKLRMDNGEIRVGVVSEGLVRILDPRDKSGVRSLSEVLHSSDPSAMLGRALGLAIAMPLDQVHLLAPVDQQEVWAAGVTYKRSREARERESEGAARFYDLVYTAARPELFFKALAERVVGPAGKVRIRKDSRWNVPEPELALVVSPQLKIVGFTIGNDMSSRDIEGENPLYLPQAKVYDQSCSLGPVITLAQAMPSADQVTIGLTIERKGTVVFEGATSLSRMARPLEELVQWLGRENSFPHGLVLLTGTGIVPPDDFSLVPGDSIAMEITGIGRLTNVVEQK